jgi:hypothetical protein
MTPAQMRMYLDDPDPPRARKKFGTFEEAQAAIRAKKKAPCHAST